MVVLGSAFVIALVTIVIVVRGDTSSRVEAEHKLAHSLVQQLARAGHLALIALDQAELTEIARTVLHTDPLIANVQVFVAPGEPIVTVTANAVSGSPTERLLAAMTRALAQPDLDLRYRSRIPPAGEGSVLDLFGTPRADIGRALITLSPAAWTRQLAHVMERALIVGLFVFSGLTLAGFTVAWTAARPLSNLRRRLRELSGAESAGIDIEHSIDVIGQRITRSEDRARRATETLRSREAELERARTHAEDAARIRADLVAGMSHELRAPLTAILGHSDLLARGGLNRGQREHVDTVSKSARNLLTLIDDVIQWSGLESGRTSLNEVGFHLAETVEDTLALLAPLAFEKDLELVHLIYRDVPVRLRGDPLRFQQILTNLVSNAVKFTEQGSVVIRIMVQDEDTDQVRLKVSVADTGPGISAAEREHLFHMYGRLETRAGGPSGSGLGLAISKRLLEMMGGSIDVESEPGQGSDFYFVLPLKKVTDREQRTSPWSGLADKRVALVEACATAATAWSRHLEDWRIQITVFADCARLAQHLDTDAGKPFDCALLGLRSRDGDAPGVQQALRAAGFAEIPVLTLVTSIDEDLHQKLIGAGATRSLPKSINPLRLYQELCELTGVEPPAATADQTPLYGLQALVADDSAAGRGYVAALLTDLGAAVAQVADGQAAVTAWRKGGFPLVLLDDQMPAMDGVTATQRIRALAVTGAAPLILGMTADTDPSAGDRFIAAGADGCLLKPFDADHLLRHARHVGAGRRPAEQARARAGELVGDPGLAALLAEELPAQLTAVETALQAGDEDAGRRAIHALHGTAAFYGLHELRAVARELELSLQDGRLPSPAQCQRLHEATADAQAGLIR